MNPLPLAPPLDAVEGVLSAPPGPDRAPYPHCPIYIPSKGRFDQTRSTLATLVGDLVPFTLVVEPHEVGLYASCLDRLVREKGGMGREEPAKEPPAANANERGGERPTALYHHGYRFQPPTATQASDEAGGKATSEFVLTSLEAVRDIFTIVALPEKDQGVSYARNFILQVLVPQQMVEFEVDRTGHLEELGLFTSGSTLGAAMASPAPPASDASKFLLPDSALRSFELDPSVYAAVERWRGGSRSGPPHSLYGYYWVMDDDIYTFSRANPQKKRNERISSRQMMRNVEARIQRLRQNAQAPNSSPTSNSGNGNGFPPHPRRANAKIPIFTGKEDVLANNWQTIHRARTPSSTVKPPDAAPGAPLPPDPPSPNPAASMDSSGSSTDLKPKTTLLNVNNYPYVRQTACFSLEYSHFSFTYGETALAVNSYNNIACLFDYHLLHNPASSLFFPVHPTGGVRSAAETLQGLPAPPRAPRPRKKPKKREKRKIPPPSRAPGLMRPRRAILCPARCCGIASPCGRTTTSPSSSSRAGSTRCAFATSASTSRRWGNFAAA
ncbi:unnamed protein product [Phytomonas sp. Hart1]|nr:unnamed protein product [Phytomonas sp. Hart1]|eukprot:CCW66932.1 unnamed protein product [Phytomonas sp. isolate Hart1]